MALSLVERRTGVEMTEAWYYFTKQLVALDPANEPENPAPAEVWKEAENVYWCRIGNRWANIITGEFKE